MIIKHTLFILGAALLLIPQMAAIIAHLLVFLFDPTYDRESAIETFYPLPRLWVRIYRPDEEITP